MNEALKSALSVHAASLETKVINEVPHLVVPNEYTLHNLEKLLPAPTRIRQSVPLGDAISFITYWQKFATDRSVIFASEAHRNFKAIFDYHLDDDAPGWGDHTAALTLTNSDEWKRWTSKNGQPMKQRDFAEFIEDNIKDVVEPTGAELLEVAKTLTVNKKLNFRSSQELSNGQVQLTYNEEMKGEAGATGQLTIPTSITIGLRVFKGLDAYSVKARFRYRISDEGVLTFSYHLDNVDKILEDAFDSVMKQISVGCSGALVFKN